MDVLFSLLHLFINVISALHISTPSSEMELYLFSVNRGADNVDKLVLESCDLGRGMQGVIGLCAAAGTAGTGVSRILMVPVCGGVDWHLSGDVCIGICGWC